MNSRIDPKTIVQTALLLVLVSLIAYLPVLRHGFFVDDDVYVGTGNHMLPTLGVTQLWRLLVERANAWEFLPVRDFTYWLDMNVLGHDANAFHIGNLVWYLVCCYGVYRLLVELLVLYRALSPGRASALAALAALLFFLHPAHVEAVAWVSGRKDILACGLFAFGAAVYVRGLRQSFNPVGLGLSALMFLAAVFSKSVAVFALLPLPLVAINVRRWNGYVPLGRLVAYVVIPVLIALAALIVHVRVGADTGIGIENSPGFVASIERASRILTTLIGIVVLPTRLRLIYDVYALGAWHWFVSSVSVLAAVAAAFGLVAGRRSLACVALLFAIVPLLAYLQFSPFVTWSLASERFAFQATLGWVIGIIYLVRGLRSEWVLACAVLLAVPFAFTVVTRVAQWESPRELRAYNAQQFPGHHSAAREFVVAHLLPERDYAAAREVAAQVRNTGARDLLQRLIDADRAKQSDIANGAATSKQYPNFCAEAVTLDKDLIQARVAMQSDPDVTLANYAGHLRAYLNRCLADVARVCVGPGT